MAGRPHIGGGVGEANHNIVAAQVDLVVVIAEAVGILLELNILDAQVLAPEFDDRLQRAVVELVCCRAG